MACALVERLEETFPKPVVWLFVLAVVGALIGMFMNLPRTGEEKATRVMLPGLVVIDAGHGGKDKGTQVFGLREKDLTLDLALRTARELDRRGIRVVLTRSEDKNMGLDERAKVASDHPGAIFLSLHFNRFRRPGVEGVEAYVTSPRDPVEVQLTSGGRPRIYEDRRSYVLAEKLVRAVAEEFSMRDRGVREARMYVTRSSPPPAVLLECGYLSNPSDALRASRAADRQRLAVLLAKELETHLIDQKGNRLLGLAPWSRRPVLPAVPAKVVGEEG